MRRTKDTEIDGERIINLPCKKYNKENIILEDEERRDYENIKNDIVDEFNSMRRQGVNITRLMIFAKIMLLKQIASHRALSNKAKLTKEFIEILKQFVEPMKGSSKTACLKDITDSLDANSCSIC